MKGTFAVGTLGGWSSLEVGHPWRVATLGGRVPCCLWVTFVGVVVAVMKFVVCGMATACGSSDGDGFRDASDGNGFCSASDSDGFSGASDGDGF